MLNLYNYFFKWPLGGFLIFCGLQGMVKPPKLATAGQQVGHVIAMFVLMGLGVLVMIIPMLIRRWMERQQSVVNAHWGWDGDTRDARQKQYDAVTHAPSGGDRPPSGVKDLLRGLACAGIGAALVAAMVYHRQRAIDVFAGPKPITTQELAAVTDEAALAALPTRFVTVKPDEEIEAEFKVVETAGRGGGQKRTSVSLLRVGDKFVTAYHKPRLTGRPFTGYLRPTGETIIAAGTLADTALKKKYPTVADNMLPVELEAQTDHPQDVMITGGVMLLAAGLFAFGSVKFYRDWRAKAAVARQCRGHAADDDDEVHLVLAPPRRL